MSSSQYDREFYRVRYPDVAAPRFVERGLTHRIVNIGAGGFRCMPADRATPMVGSVVAGIIDFRQAEPLTIEGIVVGVQAGEVDVHCAKRAIPLAVVLREQRHIRQHSPGREST